MNIFEMHDQVVAQYASYVESFLNIADDGIRQLVQEQLFNERSLWPQALVQLNPAYSSKGRAPARPRSAAQATQAWPREASATC